MYDPTFIKTRSEAEKVLARSFGYQLISSLFLHPEKINSWMPSLIQINWFEIIELCEFSNTKILKEKIQHLFDELFRDRPECWAQEYESIFGHTACSRVPLYELEYGEEHSYRQPQELADITGFYRAFGLRESKSIHERPDHISVETEFIYILLYKEAIALYANDFKNAEICQASYERFVQEHLAFWLPALTYRITKFSERSLFYRIAEFAYEFVAQDCKKRQLRIGSENLSIRPVEEKSETGCISCQWGPPMIGPEN